jgi:hypothetical protein
MSLYVAELAITQETNAILDTINQRPDNEQESLRERFDDLVHDVHEAEALRNLPDIDEDREDYQELRDEGYDAASQEASNVNNGGFDAQVAYLVRQGYAENLRLLLGMSATELLPTPPTADDFSDEWVLSQFEGTRFGGDTDGNPNALRQTLVKGLTHQIMGYWTGHTLYTIMVRAGLLVDGKPSTTKKLTPKGQVFMQLNNAPYRDKTDQPKPEPSAD